MTASLLIEEEASSCKNAAVASNAPSMVKYISNYPGMPEGSQIVLHQLKLDLVVSCNFSWREAHNKMLLHRLIALENLKKTQPPIDEDQKLALPQTLPQTGKGYRTCLGSVLNRTGKPKVVQHKTITDKIASI